MRRTPFRTVAVTRGSGHIGRNVVKAFADRGARVLALVGPGTVYGDGPGEPVEIDLLGDVALDEVFGPVDAVVHLAARSGGVAYQEQTPAELFHANQAMTRSVLESAARTGVRRVFLASSGVVYASGAPRPMTEDAPLLMPGRDDITGYAWSKICDEVSGAWSAAGEGPEVVVGRFTNVYGPGGSYDAGRSTVIHSLIGKALRAGIRGELRVWGDGSAVRSFVYVEDAARAVVSALEGGRSRARYNIDSGEAVTVARLAEMIRDAVDPTLRIVFEPDRPQGPAYRVLDLAALRGLGFQADVDLAEGIARTVAATPPEVAAGTPPARRGDGTPSRQLS